MAISLIPNKKKKGVAVSTLTEAKSYIVDFLPALAVLGIVVAIYIGTSIWYSGLQAQYDEIETEKSSLLNITKNSQTPELQSFVSRARALKSVIDNHVFSSEVFKPFEESVHPQVIITSMELSVVNKKMSLQGKAPDFETLGEQFLIWKDESIVFNEVTLISFERGEEGVVEFGMEFDIKEDYLK